MCIAQPPLFKVKGQARTAFERRASIDSNISRLRIGWHYCVPNAIAIGMSGEPLERLVTQYREVEAIVAV